MGLLKPYIDRLEKASNELDRIAIEAVRDNEKFILDLLKDEQLGKGLDSFGKDIVHPSKRSGGRIPLYEPSTQDYWAKKSPLPRTKKVAGKRYNMDWTGNFKDSMKIKAEKGGFDVVASTKRALEAIYGTKLTALTKENVEIINDKYVSPALYKHFFESAFN